MLASFSYTQYTLSAHAARALAHGRTHTALLYPPYRYFGTAKLPARSPALALFFVSYAMNLRDSTRSLQEGLITTEATMQDLGALL